MKTTNKAIYSVHIEGTPTTEDSYGIKLTKQNVRAFEGRIRVVNPGCDFFGSGASFRDYVLENPTWRSILAAAGRQIRKTGDQHHIFLEDARVVGTETDRQGRTVRLVALTLGS